MERRRLGLVVVVLCAPLLSATSCDSEAPSVAGAALVQGDEPHPLHLGRSLRVQQVDRGELEDAVVVVDDNGTEFSALRDALVDQCESDATSRFAGLSNPAGCDVRALLGDQQAALCEGHRFRQLASAVSNTDVFGDGRIEPRRALRDATEGIDDLEASLVADGLVVSFPPPSAQEAATYNLLASLAFRRASLLGADLLDPDRCPDGSLAGSLASEEPDGTPTTVTVAEVVAAATGEALLEVEESARESQRTLASAARARLSEDRDRGRATVDAWASPEDSRLAAAAVWAPIPERAFAQGRVRSECETVDADGNVVVDPEACAEEEDTPPIACSPPSSGIGRVASVLRATQVDPTIEPGRDARAILREVQFDITGDTEMSPDEWADRFLGVDMETFARGALRVREEAALAGRRIEVVDEPPNGAAVEVRHVTGTERQIGRTAPALTVARALSAPAYSDTDSLAAEQALHGGRAPAEEVGTPPRSYAFRSTLGTVDTVASTLARALLRGDVIGGSATGGGTGEIEPDSPRFLLAAALRQARSLVSARLSVAVHTNSVCEASQVDVRLFGARSDATYRLYFGADQASCAVDPGCDANPINVAPTTTTNSDGMDGFGRNVMAWSFGPSDLSGASTSVPTDSVLVVEEVRGQLPVVLGSVSTRPAACDAGGPVEPIRVAMSPAGVTVMELVAAPLETQPEECHEAVDCCGFDCNQRLPLEDELMNAIAGGRDDVESSFAYYLQAAQQAATEADNLGRLLVQEGLSMDLRAEAARDELESLCGGVVNVDTLAPKPCECEGGAAVCDAGDPLNTCGSACAYGLCEDPGGDGPSLEGSDTSSVETCLEASELTDVALGDRPLCVFRDPAIDVACVCQEDNLVGDDTCPDSCPRIKPGDAEDCAGAFPEIAGSGFDTEFLEPIGFFATQYTGPSAPACGLLAAAREGNVAISDDFGTGDAIEALRTADWFSEAAYRHAAESIGIRYGMFNAFSVTRGGSPWMTTATEQDGPAPGVFPCAPHPILEEIESETVDGYTLTDVLCNAGPLGARRSILCGIDCTDPRERVAFNARMTAAAAQLQQFSGAGGDAQSYLIPAIRRQGEAQEFEWLRFLTQLPEGDECNGNLSTSVVNRGGWGTILGGAAFDSSCESDGSPGLRCGAYCEGAAPIAAPDALDYFGTRTVPAWVGASGDWYSMVDHKNPARTTHCVVLDPPLGFDEGTPEWDAYIQVGGALCPTAHSVVALGLSEITDWTDTHVYVDEGRWSFWDRPNGQVFGLVAQGAPNEQTTHGTIRHWDALELGCLAQQRSVGGCTVPQGVDSVEDFDRLESSLLCTANRVEARLEELALLNVPRGIADDLAAGTLTNTFPENRGEYGEAVSRLRGSVESVGTATRSIANALRSFSMTLSVARAQIAIGDLQESIQLQQAIAAGFAHYTSCANAIANGGQDFAVWTNAAIAVNECKDAAVQIAVIAKTKEFQEAIASYEDRIVFQQIMESLADHSEQIQSASDLLAQSYAQINESLTRIDQIRSSASRALAKTLFLESDAAGREYHVNRVMRARMNTLRVQYEAALEKAKQNAWIARRALEQRIGMNLDAIEMDLQFVEAPASWVDEVCTLTGIDYDAIRSETAIDERGYADAFIGDYVDRLGRVLQSYSFDFPHDDGADVAVLSLRDGIDQTRVACDMRGWNELTWSVDPSAGGDAGWQRVCAPGGHCLAATALAYGPFEPSAIEGSPLTGVQARALGGAQAVELETTEVDLPDENLAFDPLVPEWQQAVFVPTGRYLLSWYERIEEGVSMEVCEPVEDGPDLCTVDYLCTDPAAPLETQLVANVRGEILPVVAPLETVYLDAEPYEHSCYRRTAVRIDNPVEQWVTVSFAHRYAAPDMLPSVGFAAPQLEALPFDAELPLAPQPFFATDDDLLWPAGLCEDTEGGSFRNSWVYACEALCPEGIGAGCEPTEDNQRCFYEKVFDLSLAGIEGRALLPSGGFAVGNYNYRHHRVGVNVVGTGVLDCANADFPSSCHGSAFLNVALRHEGPFTVRNHVGESYEAPLFPSEVEHAKALTAERYLTNPISSADEALLSRYWRGEFFGRPLDGTYRVRVYDTDALVWERVQDVQLVLDYRYWSRAN